MKKLALAAVMAAALVTIPANAAGKLNAQDKIQLQAAMQLSIKRNLVGGQYLYFDEARASVVKLFPVQAHPMILTMGPHFILCSDFRNADGKKINVDFYVARAGEKFVVFDTVIDNRKPIQKMMKAGLARVAK